MFTNCPTCRRQFRIRASQLAIAEGLVQCGFCGKQFNALERLYDKPLIIDPEIMAEAMQQANPEPEFYIPEIEAPAESLQTSQSPAIDLAIDTPAETSEPTSTAEVEPAQPGQTIVETADDDYPFPHELVDEVPQKAGAISRLFWSSGAILLLLAGATQAAWFNRDILLTRYPQFLPQAKRICQQFDCTLIRNRNISAIKLLNRDVRIHPRYEDALLVNATITNLSKYSQRFPVVLLSLFDSNGEVIAYRQIPAPEYLDNSIDIEAGMIPDTPIHFVFEVANTTNEAVSFEFDFL